MNTIEVEADIESFTESLYREGLTDGLPVVPPTEDRVNQFLEKTPRDSNEKLGTVPPRYGEVTPKLIAINAVMAGCKPEYFPVISAATRAMLDEEFNLYGINATTHPVAPLVVVNGPIVDDLRINYGYNVFGQGWRANATIGRAIRFILMNVGGGRPGDMDRATHGHPGKYSYCIAENTKESPWQPYHFSRGYNEDDNVVTVMGVEGPHEINDHVSKDSVNLLSVVADVMSNVGSNNSRGARGEYTVVFGPEHSQTVAREDWNREDVQWFLYEQARNSAEKLRKLGIYDQHFSFLNRHRIENDLGDIPLVPHPDNIHVLVAGGAGKHSMAIPSFGSTRAVSKEIKN